MSFLRALGFRGGVDKRKAERAASQALLERGSPGKISLSGALLLKCFWKPVRLGLCGCWSTVISLQKASNMKSITPGCVSPPVSGSFFLVVLVNSQDSSFPFKIKKYISIYLAVRAQLHTQDLHCIVVSAAHAGSSLHCGLSCTHRIFTASCTIFCCCTRTCSCGPWTPECGSQASLVRGMWALFPPTREGICIPCIARGPPRQSLISSFFERPLNGGILQALASGLYFFWEERLASPQGSFMELHRFQSTVG